MPLRHIEVFHAIMAAGHAPLSHGARQPVDSTCAAARACLDRGH
ncbi:hypothetical protein [Pseudoduganella namucuonensis]|nr:hypothetical protein [Pseudoduganella namucuonensis]